MSNEINVSGTATRVDTQPSEVLTCYVAGFLFSPSENHVALIRKNRGPTPDMVGKWNALGGKIEEGETTREAMAREFEEEAGLKIIPEAWQHFCTLRGSDFAVFFFVAKSPAVFRARTMEDETVRVISTDLIVNGSYSSEVMPNVRWLIPMALSRWPYPVENGRYIVHEDS